MHNAATTLVLALLAAALLAWGFRCLPGERWQIIASVPFRKGPGGRWLAINLALFLALTAAVGVPRLVSLAVLGPLLVAGMSAAKIVARLVENKQETLTVGGAVFVTTLAAPPVLLGADALVRFLGHAPLPLIPILAAASVAYAFGEGFGRLACISFGCCYGRPLGSLPRPLRPLLERLAFTFHGSTKKIAYASGLEGVKVVPIQAMTAAVYVGVGVAGFWLFLEHAFAASLASSFVATQLWRGASELLRADERGGGRISAYQKMTLAGLLYVALVAPLFPGGAAPEVDLATGLASLADVRAGLFIEALWVVVFVATGLSKVTGSTVSFHVHRNRV
jgi:hypothetical protein